MNGVCLIDASACDTSIDKTKCVHAKALICIYKKLQLGMNRRPDQRLKETTMLDAFLHKTSK